MKRYVLMFCLLALPAAANPIDDALKKVGPAYMCGPDHEYRDAIKSVKQSMIDTGVPEMLADFSVSGLETWIATTHRSKKGKISKEECERAYNR